MPLYDFYCPKCKLMVEIFASPTEVATHTCGTKMERRFPIPRVIMKQSASDMALNSLNSKETSHMKPEMKELAARGLGKAQKTIF